MQGERLAGGLWCHEVLDLLSDYVDGELASVSRGAVDAHLAACDRCERFGGEYARTVQRIREALSEPESLDGEMADRLRERLKAEWQR